MHQEQSILNSKKKKQCFPVQKKLCTIRCNGFHVPSYQVLCGLNQVCSRMKNKTKNTSLLEMPIFLTFTFYQLNHMSHVTTSIWFNVA